MTRAQTKLGFKLLTFVLMLGVGSLQGLAIAQPKLRITSPKDKTVFGPGDKVDVNVEGSGANFEGVLVGVGSLPIKAFTSPPFRYSLETPAAIESGKYSIMAHGWVKPGEAVDADPVDLIVDRRDRPITLRLEPSRLSLRVGETASLRVWGIFGGRPHEAFAPSPVELTGSSRTTCESGARGVATVSNDGTVLAVAPGSTKITVRYGASSATVPVVVRNRRTLP